MKYLSGLHRPITLASVSALFGLGTLVGCADAAPSTVIESGVGVVVDGCAGLASEVGSGMTVERRGQVVTTAHTVAGATTITVVDHDGLRLPATVSALDADADLALLSVPGLDTIPLAVGEAETGEANAIVWSRETGLRRLPLNITKQLKVTIEDIYVEDIVVRSAMELRGDVNFGDSGGAVINGDGDIVGIIYARSRQRPETAFATDHAELERFLGERPLDDTNRCR